ncbi:acyl-CoA dehydratase activase-related protein [Proteinivorax hydrogeniformans]|uniref:Acyl-CoA dehydratase activase-related protein n=1 Tax=Proteinivorax hydrogeniformans TaxID=1826727 RepID=A0AAU8HQC4_9FIRM
MKNKLIGIPKTLLYYNVSEKVEEFFNILGVETLISPPTTKAFIKRGNSFSIDEACLPVKAGLGHLDYLANAGVDAIFLPRVVAIEKKKYICPKFLGLPEYCLSLMPHLPKLISPRIDLRTNNGLKKFCVELSRELDISPTKIRKTINKLNDKKPKKQKVMNKEVNVAVLGHSYNIYDPGLNSGILEKVKNYADVKTVEDYTDVELKMGKDLLPKPLFWSYGEEIAAAALSSMEKGEVQGIIVVTSFGCGPHSFVTEIIEQHRKKRRQTPIMFLTLDEHSAEAGLITRIEAFMDLLMLRREKLWA